MLKARSKISRGIGNGILECRMKGTSIDNCGENLKNSRTGMSGNFLAGVTNAANGITHLVASTREFGHTFLHEVVKWMARQSQ